MKINVRKNCLTKNKYVELVLRSLQVCVTQFSIIYKAYKKIDIGNNGSRQQKSKRVFS